MARINQEKTEQANPLDLDPTSCEWMDDMKGKNGAFNTNSSGANGTNMLAVLMALI